jgi:hypothetical protein
VLGLERGLIGGFDQGGNRRQCGGVDHAEAGGGPDDLVSGRERDMFDLCAAPLGQDAGLFHRFVGDDYGKLVPPVARRQIACPAFVLQPPGDFLQALVADGVPRNLSSRGSRQI